MEQPINRLNEGKNRMTMATDRLKKEQHQHQLALARIEVGTLTIH